MNILELLLKIFAAVTLVYFVTLTVTSLVLTAVAWHSGRRSLRSRPQEWMDDAFASPLTPGVSVLLPAFNEESGIVESVRSLLAVRYPRLEVIVINDGSSDATLARLREAFDLVPIHRAMRGKVPSRPIRGAYISRRNRELCVIDKDNGGKADALNTGVDAARHPYVCAVDADGLLEETALLRVAKPILDDPDLVVATGGTVRIVNGCRVDHGRVVDESLPKSRLATLQVIEYLRMFLVGRVGWSRMKSLLLISGAFGLFRRSLVEEVGGYSDQTVGEDMELILRLHRHLLEQEETYRIEFVADPVCWTVAPDDLRSLSRQRRRWQRGLGESLWRHRRMIGNPRYGSLGLVGLPFLLFFEFVGPVIEVLGPVTVLGWFLLGQLSLAFAITFFMVSLLLGIFLSLSALVLGEAGFRKRVRAGDVRRLLAYCVAENFGYRQLSACWRVVGLVDLARRKKDWGAHGRRGFRGPIAAGQRVAPAAMQDPRPQLRATARR
jgi:cellulose synthase/poly-beta-1,6-N-acetylglucosamine synthase-like glycosyltransferase